VALHGAREALAVAVRHHRVPQVPQRKGLQGSR
jgi:hypothetical protein